MDDKAVDPEKRTVEHIDAVRENASSDVASQHDFTPEEQRRIIRRIDLRLIGTVSALYCVSLVDRTNMSAASIAGMNVGLKLQGLDYNIANLVFFIPYIIFEPPSTIVVRRLGPRLHISIIALCWGATMIGMGFVNSFQQLAGVRVVLGFLEAGFFPSCVYLLSTWYTRYEVGKRYSLFYLLATVSSAFAGILAYGLMQLNGRHGLAGWRWIFIIEGVLTCGLAIVSYWLLVDFPDSTRKTWKFLTQRESQWVVDRIQKDRGDSSVPPFNLRKFVGGAADWKIWAYGILFCFTTTITYALGYSLPLILVSSMKFSIAQAQCLVAPPYVFAGIVMFTTHYLGDKFRLRGPVIMFNLLLCLVGLPIMGWHPRAGVRYFGVFLVTAGANGNIPAIMSLQANNLRGQWKRAFCSATLVGFGAVGGIIGSLVFRDEDKETGYKPGMYASIACCLLNVIIVLLVDFEYFRQNKLADQGKRSLECNGEDVAPDNFRYTY
ncbi:transporter [Tolypocladium capitatum]|uniref:Transporter n=1 Tax=Tolypocladium capitatum TaxID=45235 RepID=A0A2K3QQV7_9HYPO|nr:transporter [Tolypocladium capitatum]